MQTRTDTTQYVAAHGKAPRGTGLWFLTGVASRHGSHTSFDVQHNGTLTEARAALVRKVRNELGNTCDSLTVFVGS